MVSDMTSCDELVNVTCVLPIVLVHWNDGRGSPVAVHVNIAVFGCTLVWSIRGTDITGGTVGKQAH